MNLHYVFITFGQLLSISVHYLHV